VTLQAFSLPRAAAARGEVLVTRARPFEAAHAYRDPAFGRARRVHGHNYVLAATIAGPVDPGTHFLVDFRDLDTLLKEVTAPLDHRRLDVEYALLAGREPSAEAIAVALYAQLAPLVARSIPNARLVNARLIETDELWADANGGEDVELTRSYGFSAAHRLADPKRSDEDNRRIYGKCANPEPHGHDYRFEVTVRGQPDPRIGTVTNLAELDRCVDEAVVGPFDHRYLNAEVAPFTSVIPTGERIAERIWELLAPKVRGLSRIVVYETPRESGERAAGARDRRVERNRPRHRAGSRGRRRAGGAGRARARGPRSGCARAAGVGADRV
jgi:6-pyruvoyltetrahydropterin/6-carboxytetrahydropterin synthase